MKTRSTTGFTLIELAVVLAIIGILAGVLVPRLPDVTAWKLKSSARRLSGTISSLYDYSARTQLVYRLTLDIDKNEYFVSLLNIDNEFEKADFDFAKQTSLPTNIKINQAFTATQGALNSGKAVIHFLPSGVVDASVIYLEDKSSNRFTLTIHPLTGRVKIIEGFKELKAGRASAQVQGRLRA